MDNSLLVSLSQQLASYQSMDVIANNIANVSTPGYRREAPTFQEYVTQVPPTEGETGMQTLSFVQDTGIARDMSEGPRTNTGAPFDVAIHGKGFFVVQTPTGNVYTRDGHFGLDTAGQIVDDAGNPVQGDGGAITISPDDGDIHIGVDGTLSGKNGQIAKLKVAAFADETALQKVGARDVRGRFKAFKVAMGARTARVNHALGDALMVEMHDLFAQDEILQQNRPPRAYLARRDGPSRCRVQYRHDVPSA